VIINVIAFAVFWLYPLAPPRLLPGLGYIDVVGRSHALVSWQSGPLVHSANQLAGMPSLHVAWATWSALALWKLYPRRVTAAVALAYPLRTATVVIATANHYLFDVAAGATTPLAAVALQRAVKYARANRPGRHAVSIGRG
jgi:diacylglycerol O-acyltransferase / wax synthase